MDGVEAAAAAATADADADAAAVPVEAAGDDAMGGARASASSPARVLGKRDGDAREISPSPEAKRRETSPPPPPSE